MNNLNPLEAERHVLSAMLESLPAVWEVISVMRVGDMAEPRHETIASVILALAERDSIVGPTAVIDELERAGELNRIGGPAYLWSLNGYTPTPTNVGFYAAIVHDDAKRRRVAAATLTMQQAVTDKTLPIDQVLDTARAALDAAAADTLVVEEVDPQAEMIAALESVGEARPAFPSRFPDLNEYMHGFEPGKLYIIGARPSVGKSAVALQFATDLAAYGTVGFFTLEMGVRETRLRQISQEAEISHHLLTGGKRLPEYLHDRAYQYALNSPPILIDDRPVLTTSDVRAQLRTWVHEHDMTAIVIDYLQLMSGDMSQGKVQMITEISRQLKLISKEFNVAVIALSQLNRASETRADKMPLLSDLRESGSIEQDADVVMLLHRDLMNEPQNMELIIAKSRSGQTGILRYQFQGDFVRMF